MFGSKKKTYTSASYHRLIEDEKQLPSTVATAVIKSILGGYDLAPYVVQSIIYGPPFRVVRYFNYADRGQYYFGLPENSLDNLNTIEAVFRDFLFDTYGSESSIEYSLLTSQNVVHQAYSELDKYSGYLSNSNTLSDFKYLAYIDYVQGVINNSPFVVPDEEDPEEIPFELESDEPYKTLDTPAYEKPNPYRTETVDTTLYLTQEYEDGYRLRIQWDNTDSIHQDSLNTFECYQAVDIEESDFYLAKINNSQGTHYFTYQKDSGIYPELDDVEGSKLSDIYKFMPFIHIKSTLSDLRNQNGPHYKSSNKMSKFLGTTYKELQDQIYGINKSKYINLASLGFFVPLNTNREVEKKYLYHFYLWLQSIGITNSSTSLTISDYQLNLRHGLNNLSTGILNENKVEIGKYGSEIGNITTYIEVEENGVISQIPQKKYLFRFFYQESENVCKYVDIDKPYTFYSIPRKPVTAHGQDLEADNYNLIVPVSYTLAKEKFTFNEREKLLYSSAGIVLTTYQRVKVKWYQRGAFKVVMTVIAVVAVVVSLGSAAPAVAAAWSAGFAAFSIAVMTIVVKALLVTYGLKLLVKAVGVEVGTFLAIVALAYGIKSGISGDTSFGLDASNWLQVSNNLTTSVNERISEYLTKSQEDLLRTSEWYNSELERINEFKNENGLGFKQSIIDPLMFSQTTPITYLGEYPDTYYTRTVHTGNIGINALEYPRTYVDVSLRLPSDIEISRRDYNG